MTPRGRGAEMDDLVGRRWGHFYAAGATQEGHAKGNAGLINKAGDKWAGPNDDHVAGGCAGIQQSVSDVLSLGQDSTGPIDSALSLTLPYNAHLEVPTIPQIDTLQPYTSSSTPCTKGL